MLRNVRSIPNLSQNCPTINQDKFAEEYEKFKLGRTVLILTM